MKLNKTFLTLGLAAALLQMPASSFAQNAGGSRQNPLLQKSNLPFGAPDFSKIQESDYLPAIETAIKEQRANIQKIVNNKKKPTFQNTILAFEESGVLLDRVTSIFYGLTSAHRTPAIAETEKKATPMLTELDNEISFNQKLFERIKYVYDNEYKKLKGEDQRLTEVIYKRFVRSGALLSAEKMERMKQINSRISDLQQKWDNLLPAATNNAVVWVNSKEELAGLSEADIAQCKKDAESRGSKSPYCIVIINTTQQPILTNLQNRELRRKVYMASIHRADGTNPDFNTFPIVTEIAKLLRTMKERKIEIEYQFAQLEELSQEEQNLVKKAIAATQNSYANYSHFYVGASCLLEDGSIVIGANQENAAFPSGLCAERTAVFAAQANHPELSIKTIAIAARNANGFLKDPISPCGACRQVILEIEDRYKQPVRILLYGTEGIYCFRSIKDLLPFSFVDANMR